MTFLAKFGVEFITNLVKFGTFDQKMFLFFNFVFVTVLAQSFFFWQP